jgi:hypothetical protein
VPPAPDKIQRAEHDARWARSHKAAFVHGAVTIINSTPEEVLRRSVQRSLHATITKTLMELPLWQNSSLTRGGTPVLHAAPHDVLLLDAYTDYSSDLVVSTTVEYVARIYIMKSIARKPSPPVWLQRPQLTAFAKELDFRVNGLWSPPNAEFGVTPAGMPVTLGDMPRCAWASLRMPAPGQGVFGASDLAVLDENRGRVTHIPVAWFDTTTLYSASDHASPQL